jgi:modulator of FtsH protease
MAYDPAAWQNFYITTGGAAAALTGLLFVAMSLHAKAIMAHPVLGNRAVGTLISLITQLAIAGAVLSPGQPVLALGIEVEIAAVFWAILSTTSVYRARASLKISPTRSLIRVILESIGGSVWLALFLASGLSLILRAGGGFYLLALLMLFMFGWNVYVCWSLIAEVAD